MKKTIFVTLFLLSIFTFSQEKTFNSAYFYEFTFQRDSTNIERKYSELMVLLVNTDESLYTSYVKMKNDSILLSNFEKSNQLDFSALPQKSRVNHQAEFNKASNSTFIYDKILNATFKYQSSKIEWKIGNEKKNILGYNCQNAFCIINKRKYTAWFTTDIPINDGPYKFKKLPGLVLEVYDDKKYFHFVMKGIKNKQYKIKPTINSIETTETQFVQKRNDFFKDPVGASKIYMGDRIRLDDPKSINDKFKNDNLFLD
ncbi:GLPGLI family protein [Chryseobacterium taihuense]|uniref:GLPGLI family protein n=1 Tax=Chryseobacterium taihuense TaxID=1141221 RepID=A0ABY0QVN2_9FLAO|nr:GLPGLI family protein [Chryseobacterium taihuense]SDL98403.1 GLPGLI family protein [Chryseobacterium taihuense]